MKTKNQTEPALLDIAAATAAANEDGITTTNVAEPLPVRKQAWSPIDVWRTRMKTPSQRILPEPT